MYLYFTNSCDWTAIDQYSITQNNRIIIWVYAHNNRFTSTTKHSYLKIYLFHVKYNLFQKGFMIL